MIPSDQTDYIENLFSSLEMDDAIYNFGLCNMGVDIVLWLTKEMKSNGAARNFIYLIQNGKILWDELRYKPPQKVIDACNRLARLIVFL